MLGNQDRDTKRLIVNRFKFQAILQSLTICKRNFSKQVRIYGYVSNSGHGNKLFGARDCSPARCQAVRLKGKRPWEAGQPDSGAVARALSFHPPPRPEALAAPAALGPVREIHQERQDDDSRRFGEAGPRPTRHEDERFRRDDDSLAGTNEKDQ